MVTFWLIFTSVTTTKIFYGVCSDGGPNGAPPSPPNFIRILLDLEVSEAHKVQDPRLDPNHNLGLYNFFKKQISSMLINFGISFGNLLWPHTRLDW